MNVNNQVKMQVSEQMTDGSSVCPGFITPGVMGTGATSAYTITCAIKDAISPLRVLSRNSPFCSVLFTYVLLAQIILRF